MRICLIGGIYGPGGIRKGVLEVTPETTLEDGLRAAGHQVKTLSHYDRADFGAFDVVHVHHLSYGAVRLACDRSRTPFVFTAHDTSRMCGQPQPWPYRAAMRYVLSRVDGVVALTAREADFQRRAFRLAGAAYATIPNGIPADIYRCRRENTAGHDRAWQILFVGQLIPLKGVDLILRALPLLPSKAELTLVYQNDTMEPELRTLAAALKLAGRVRFLGRRSPAELAALYRSSDLLVLPSATEALPSVLIEAMLSGLPFVATAVGGIPELAGRFGMLFDRRDPIGISQAIACLLEHYEDFARTGEAMSAAARERFAIPRMIERHLEFYRQVIHSAVPRRHAVRYQPLNAVVRNALAWAAARPNSRGNSAGAREWARRVES